VAFELLIHDELMWQVSWEDPRSS